MISNGSIQSGSHRPRRSLVPAASAKKRLSGTFSPNQTNEVANLLLQIGTIAECARRAPRRRCPPARLNEKPRPGFRAFLARRSKARNVFENGRAGGLESLRRIQFKLAETNAAMAIFLGKTYLGQSDRRELERSGAIDYVEIRQRVREKLVTPIDEAPAAEDREGE